MTVYRVRMESVEDDNFRDMTVDAESEEAAREMAQDQCVAVADEHGGEPYQVVDVSEHADTVQE